MSRSEKPFFYTWSAQSKAEPWTIKGGEGATFETDEGRWLDLGALSYQANLGHGSARMREAIKAQCDRLLLTVPSGLYPEKEALAKRLLEIAPPGFTKVFFTLGGAEATENALKIARLFTGRHKLLSRYRSYHGASMGALSLSGDYRRPPLEPGLPGVIHALDCYQSRLPGGERRVEGGGELEQLERIFRFEGPGSIAAMFLEPVPGANGALVPPADYWPAVRALTERHGTLLVADEVLTGFGRCGRWLAHQHWDVVPDLITLSKGITGGYAPLGAVLVHEKVARHFEDRFLYCGLTFYGHPLGVAAGLEALSIYEDEGLIEGAAALGEVLAAELAALQDRHAGALPRTRALGLLAGLEAPMEDAAWARLDAALTRRRIFVHLKASERTIVVAPPLCISEAQLREGLGLLEECLVEAWGEG